MAADWVARAWAGPSAIPSSLRLEWQLVIVRWAGIISIGPGLLLAPLTPAQLWAAYAVIGLDIVFNTAVQLGISRYPRLLTNGLLVMLGDSLITVMIISAAGYRDSPLSYAFFLVAVSAALRYGYRSLLVVGFFVTCDWINKASAPTAPDAPFIIRSVFLCLTAILTSYIYGQVHKTQTALLRQEINEAAAINEALEHQAQHDLLTLLPNRALLQISLEQAIQTYDTSGVTQALLLMDLDRFKDVNDTFGHRFGDLLLQQIGPRAREVLGTSALLARLGGDEFAVLLDGGNSQTAAELGVELVTALEKPFSIEGHVISVGVSIGIALLPEHGCAPDTLLQHADVAMYNAKRRRLGWVLYAPEQDNNTPERITLANELRDAIGQDELTVYLQPQVSLNTRSLKGVEALVRWQHPKRGLVFPDQFISVAESTGLIRGLTHWVLNAALREIHNLAGIGIVVPVSVNFSMRDLHDADLPHTVESLLARWSVHPAQLTVEITESSLMDDPPRALQTIRSLSSMGVRISIDDFGTGYSSLSYLKQLPVDELKIDRSFVQHLANDKKDAAIVRSTIGLAHDLGLQVVAEGIEDMDTWVRLRALKCDTAQGYLISRPMPAQQLPEWVREQWGADKTLAAAA